MIYVRRKFQYSCTESEKSFMFVKIVMDRFFRCSSVNGKFPHIYIYIYVFLYVCMICWLYFVFQEIQMVYAEEAVSLNRLRYPTL